MSNITINHTPTLYVLNGYDWECQHITTDEQQVEEWDGRRELESGVIQPVYFHTIEVCETCHEVVC